MTAQSQAALRCAGCMTELTASGPCPICHWDDAVYGEVHHHLPRHYVLLNRYYIGRVLGQGGFGITYLAYDLRLAKRVAVKEYFPTGLCNRLMDRSTIQLPAGDLSDRYAYGMSRFLEEARTLAQLDSHPCIVPVNEFVEANGTAYMVMAYLEGITLKEYLARQPGGAISWQLTVNTVLPVMEALREVHMHGLLHRDISPDNIFITDRKEVKLLDFGAARHAVAEVSQSLSVILKPGYGPEEQYRTNGKQGPWTDVYAVAATMYRCITGQTPPPAIDRLAEDTLKPPSGFNRELTAGVDGVILRGMAVRAANRYQNIADFQTAVASQSAAGGSGVKSDSSIELSVEVGEAANGCWKLIDVPGRGQLRVHVPAGVRSGGRLRLAGQAPGGGDLYVELTIVEPPPPLPAYALYDDGAVAIATLCGGPLAGALIMAGNYRRLQRGSAAVAIVLCGLAVYGLSILLNRALDFAPLGIGITMIFVLRSIAERDQGPAVAAHVAAGGRLYSRWRAAGVGFLYLLLTLAVTVGSAYAYDQITDPRVTIGNKDNVHYVGGATRQEARSLGDALQKTGYFQDRGVSVFLSKERGTTISFMVKESRPDLYFQFENFARNCADSVGGLPIRVRLIDTDKITLKELNLGRVTIGEKYHVYYLDSATEDDAQTVAVSLKSVGYFTGGGADVFVSKGDGTSVSFVVQDGYWNNRNGVSAFRDWVRSNARSLGGLPIQLRFLDSSLNLQKEITVQ